MKLSSTAIYGLVGIGLVVLLCIALTVYAVSGSTKIGPAIDPTICEYCGSKLNKSGECSRCISEMGPEKYRQKRESKNWYNSPVIASIVIGSLGLLASIHFGLALRNYIRKRRPEASYYVRCSKCGRKLRYRESQIERLGKCPLCQKAIRFPKPVLPPKPSVWSKLGGLSWRRIREIVWD